MKPEHIFNKDDMVLDTYIGEKIQHLRASPRNIEAPCEFVDCVMDKVSSIEKSRVLRMQVFFGLVALTPIAVRLVWHFVRHDFFSVSGYPFGSVLIKIYGLAMAPATFIILFGIGFIIASRWFGTPKFQIPTIFYRKHSI